MTVLEVCEASVNRNGSCDKLNWHVITASVITATAKLHSQDEQNCELQKGKSTMFIIKAAQSEFPALMMSDDVLKLHLLFLEKYFRPVVAGLTALTSSGFKIYSSLFSDRHKINIKSIIKP